MHFAASLRRTCDSALPPQRWAGRPPDSRRDAGATFARANHVRYSFYSHVSGLPRRRSLDQEKRACIYQALIVAIATRHADAVDIKFLVDGRTVWVALPHPAWVEYKKRTGKVITDQLAVEIAGHYLKTALESGEGVGREMYSLTVDETFKHLDAVANQPEAVANWSASVPARATLGQTSSSRPVERSSTRFSRATKSAELCSAGQMRTSVPTWFVPKIKAGRSVIRARKSSPAANARAEE